MKPILTFVILIMVCEIYASASEQNYEDCAEIYVSVENARGRLNAIGVSEFLNALSCDYSSTAEGGEFGSELIMIVLENSTKEFISEFDKLSQELQKQIIEEVKSPIHDGFDLQNIYNNVANSNMESPAKSKLLSAIRTAVKGQGGEIK